MDGPVEDFSRLGVRLDVDGEIATITLNRPERRNAMTFGTWRALGRIGDTLPEGVRIVVVRGAGSAFSAGIDLRLLKSGGIEGEGSFEEVATSDDTTFDELIAEAQRGFTWLRRDDIVSVAAVQGYAIGAGFQLALSCDLRVLSDDAQLCMKEPTLGLVPDLTGTKPLTDIVGVPRALEICLTGRMVGAAEARDLRLAELVVPGAELAQAVQDLCAALLATGRETAAATKRLLRAAPGRTLEEQCAAERREQADRIRALFGREARGPGRGQSRG